MNIKRTLQHSGAVIFTALFALHINSADARSIYRWTDQQGQVHFSDQAPANDFTATELRKPDTSLHSGGSLRVAETELLQQIQQHAKQQQQLAQSRRLKASRAQAEHQQRCNANREKLQASRGRGNYKQYAGFLRKHCW